VMAGGQGKRMKSSLPKVLNEVGGQPMISRIVNKVVSLGIENVLIVCGQFENDIRKAITNIENSINVIYVRQDVPQGTGDAIKQCLPYLPACDDTSANVDVLILNGDTPLIDKSLDDFIKCQAPSLMVTSLDNPKGQGRICQDPNTKRFERIVEEKDANNEQKAITLVNCGVYLVSSIDLQTHVPLITNNNAQCEYYLTDICGMMKDALNLYELPKSMQYELINVNTVEDLHTAQLYLCEDFFKTHLLQLRTLEVADYDKGYLDLLRQLSDTITISSFKDFQDIYEDIRCNGNNIIYVLEDVKSKAIVANCTLLKERKFIRGGKNAVHIEDVVVDNKYRGLNIGVQLMRYMIAKSALHLDAYKVILDCKDELEKFYSRSGFTTSAIQMSRYN
jgi:bifunctional N-acetylglucosamine-1-phosphate-uridyltransferase/glucosamine-1-phosphate-acetyltransferase GlmU-like protein